MEIQPYLFFGGRCEEAIEFYKQALGAKLGMLLRNSESPEPHEPGSLAPGFENKVMHAAFHIGEATIMASDGRSEQDGGFHGFALSLDMPNEAEARRRFAALAEGGEVRLALTRTFFSPCFGMLVDRFGITWMVLVRP